jgi:O-antigen ligase
MISHDHPQTAKPLHARPLPWVLFLFLSAAFFLTFHDLAASKSIGDYNQAPDDVIAEVAEGALGRRIALLSLGVVAIVSLVRSQTNRRLSVEGPLAWLLLGFVTWALISPIWAEDLSQNIKRLTGFVILCIAAVAIVRRLSLREVILWTFFSTSAFLLIGIVAEIINGTFQPLSSEYRFAGTLPPNNEGINCALLLLSAVTMADLVKRRRVLFWICGFIGLVFLVLSGSRTGLGAAVLAVIIYMVAVRSRSARVAMVLSAIMVACFLVFSLGAGLMPGFESAVLLGRDDPGSITTFTGRTGIWDDVSPYIERSPIAGYGFGGFWTPARISEISDEEQWGVGNSHSAYVDYLLGLGGVGLSLFILILFFGIFAAFRAFRSSRRPVFAFGGVVLVFCAMDGLFESDITEGSQLMFVCAVILIRLAFVPVQRNLRIGSPSRFGSGTEIAAQTLSIEPFGSRVFE